MPALLRRILLASPLVLWPVAATPDDAGPRLVYGVDRPTETAPRTKLHADFQENLGWLYGGVKAALEQKVSASGTYDLYAGLKPQIGESRFDLRFREHHVEGGDRSSHIALDFSRPLAHQVELHARFELDTHSLSGAGQARAAWQVTGSDRFEATLREKITGGLFRPNAYEVRVLHAFHEDSRLSVFYRIPVDDADRVEIRYDLEF